MSIPKLPFPPIVHGCYAIVRADGTGPVTHLNLMGVTINVVNANGQLAMTLHGTVCEAPPPAQCEFTVEKSGVRCELPKGHKGRCSFVSARIRKTRKVRK